MAATHFRNKGRLTVSQTTSVSHIPASYELVLLVEIFFNPAALQGGGSLSAISLPQVTRKCYFNPAHSGHARWLRTPC